MTVESVLLSAFAPPSACLSDKVRNFLDELEPLQDANRLMHMRTGRRQLETFLKKQHEGSATFEQEIKRDSLQWKEHVDKARQDKDIRVQDRQVLPGLLPGLKLMHDIKVGRPGKPDDAVYLKSAYARQWLPRGNCIAEWQVEDTTYFFPLVRGYRKFTGQEDDGELKQATKSGEIELSKFFIKPQTQSKWVISTSKENGEAGHLAVLKRSDGEFVYVLGSKNTHVLARTINDIECATENQKKTDVSDTFFAPTIVAAAILRMVIGLSSHNRNVLCEFLWQTRATASFEVLCPSHQHVQLLDYLSEDTPVFYGLSLMTFDCLEGTEICVSPVLLYEFMRKLGIHTVTYEVVAFNADAFEATLELSKGAYQHEGDVYLFLDEAGTVIGMQKHKSVWYVCLRAIREKAKTFCRALNSRKPLKGRSKPMSPKEALDTAKESMQKRFQAIARFVRISDETSNAFKALGQQFIEYLFENELFRGVAAGKEEEQKCKQAAKDVAYRFPVVWKRFLQEAGVNDAISIKHPLSDTQIVQNPPNCGISDGVEPLSFKGHSQNIKFVTFVVTDNELLASGSSDATIKLWLIELLDAQQESCKKAIYKIAGTVCRQWTQTMLGHSSKIWYLAAIASGESLYSGSGDGTTKIWTSELR
ncbi:unnamed protein product [Peronospora farinosa]|uniref:DUF7920 domain-containing protein n=1 Tax=Peronospora farinosa TaxID=134698 RepID=A0AAV0UDH6_9STRA|nr:unnamed protein product [Peronospora farinosa]